LPPFWLFVNNGLDIPFGVDGERDIGFSLLAGVATLGEKIDFNKSIFTTYSKVINIIKSKSKSEN
jgi:hypothetical protein